MIIALMRKWAASCRVDLHRLIRSNFSPSVEQIIGEGRVHCTLWPIKTVMSESADVHAAQVNDRADRQADLPSVVEEGQSASTGTSLLAEVKIDEGTEKSTEKDCPPTFGGQGPPHGEGIVRRVEPDLDQGRMGTTTDRTVSSYAVSELKENSDETDALKVINPFSSMRRAPHGNPQENSSGGLGTGSPSKDEKVLVLPPAWTSPSDFVPTPRVKRMIVGPTEEECYAVDHKGGRGVCLIVSNDRFAPELGLSMRRGNEADLRAAMCLFQSLGFEVRVLENSTHAQLLRTLDLMAMQEDHSDKDAMALVVLSHGDEGVIYAHDRPFVVGKLWEPFTADRAPTLAGKPKLFFIQACQGSRMDEGVKVVTRTDAGSVSSTSFASYQLPVHADFLLAHSTVAGFYSWRNTVHGSWFIQALAAVCRDYGRQNRDLASLLAITCKRISIDYLSSSTNVEFHNKKQTPFYFSTLRYKLYLPYSFDLEELKGASGKS